MTSDTFRDRVLRLSGDLPNSVQEVARFIARHPDIAATSSAAEIAEATGTSDATVVRCAQALGYSGLKEMRRAVADLLTTRVNPGALLASRIEQLSDAAPIRQVFSDTVGSLAELVERLDEASWQRCVDLISSAQGVLCYGMPPVGFAVQYLSLMLNRVGVRSTSETATGAYLADRILDLRTFDVVIVFAPLIPFAEVNAVVRRARDAGARTILISEAIGMPISSEADEVIVTPTTSFNTAGEVVVPLFLAHSLALSVASAAGSQAVTAMDELNRLRRTILE
jgi:DNA-binding MurR/RpiR family transcriptional regulator